MKRVLFALLALTLVAGWASPAVAGGLKLTIRDGRVSLDAQEVTIRQILAEWARVGKTRIVNGERVNGAPVTLKFDNLAEDEALDIILRAVPGYMAAPRATVTADASIYDRIVIMPTTSAVTVTAAAAPRMAAPMFPDPSPNVTQLRPTPPLLSPGVVPELPEDPRNSNDPAIAAAAAAGLTAVPAPQPGTIAAPSGALQPPVRNAGTSMLPQPQTPAAKPAAPSNPWNVPVGASQPGLAPPATPPSALTPPPARPAGTRPQQADQ
jgi:hypothetical protein